jgi:hypothetical protein
MVALQPVDGIWQATLGTKSFGYFFWSGNVGITFLKRQASLEMNSSNMEPGMI